MKFYPKATNISWVTTTKFIIRFVCHVDLLGWLKDSFIRRRYQNLLGAIPILSHENNHTNQTALNHSKSSSSKNKTELIQDDLDGKFVDCNWITPNFDKSGDNKSYSVKRAGPGLGSFKVLEMSEEDSDWIP